MNEITHNVIIEVKLTEIEFNLIESVYLFVLFCLQIKGVNSVNLNSITDINDNGLKLTQHVGYVKICENLKWQKHKDQEDDRDVKVIDYLFEEALFIC